MFTKLKKYMSCACRLAADVAAASFQQTQSKIDTDLMSLGAHFKALQEHANRQAF